MGQDITGWIISGGGNAPEAIGGESILIAYFVDAVDDMAYLFYHDFGRTLFRYYGLNIYIILSGQCI